MRIVLLLSAVAPGFVLLSTSQQPTFEGIAPVIYRSCTPCHSPGGAAPFSLRNYEEVRRRSERVGIMVASYAMPPCQITTDFGSFSMIPGITSSDIAAIRRWATSGTPGPAGEPAPEMPPFEWRLGKGGSRKDVRQIEVPAEGGIHWVTVRVPHSEHFQGSIRGFEIKPRDPQVIRRAVVGWAKAGTPMTSVTTLSEGVEPIGAWAPGYFVWRSPRGSGVHIPEGSELHVLLQCQSVGKPGDASFELAYYREPRQTTTPLRWVWLEQKGFTLQPGDKRVMTMEHTLTEDARLISLLPDFRYACERVELTADMPGHDTVDLMKGRWDVYWTGAYTFINPTLLPAGTRLRLDAHFNNGFDAAHGPDIRDPIHWGTGPRQEMCRMGVQLLSAAPPGSGSSASAVGTATGR